MATTYTRTAVAPFGAITVHRVITAISGVVATLRTWNDTRRTPVRRMKSHFARNPNYFSD